MDCEDAGAALVAAPTFGFLRCAARVTTCCVKGVLYRGPGSKVVLDHIKHVVSSHAADKMAYSSTAPRCSTISEGRHCTRTPTLESTSKNTLLFFALHHPRRPLSSLAVVFFVLEGNKMRRNQPSRVSGLRAPDVRKREKENGVEQC